jgi:NAD(P)-dependent dehydrogenase (short-subunit alcohol dehydrogenase family)
MTRVHLVTGAGSGIGAAVAHALHARGDELVLLARTQPRAHELQQQYDGARVVVADLADPSRLEQALAGANLPLHLDSVLHVAGVVDLAPAHDLTYDEVRAQVDVNLVAPMLLTGLCLPALRAARGTVVFVNSGAGLNAHPTWGAYAASKFGLRGFADALRGEEAPHGVRVTSVFPGRTATPMQEKVHEQEQAAYDAERWIQPETVAATILHVLDLPRDAMMPEVSVRPGPG